MAFDAAAAATGAASAAALASAAGQAAGAGDALVAVLGRIAAATNSASEALARIAASGAGAAPALRNAGAAAGQAASKIVDTSKGAAMASKGLDSLGQSAASSLQALVPHNAALDAAVKALQAMGPEGEAAAVALQVVATVVAFAAVTLWDWVTAAVAAAQKRDALIATFDALGGGAGAGERTLAATERIAASLPFVRSQVDAWAKGLMAAGVSGESLEKGLRAVAASTAIMGESGGAAMQKLIERFQQAADMGLKVKIDRRILKDMKSAGIEGSDLAKVLGVNEKALESTTVGAAKLGAAMQTAIANKGGPALEALGLTWDSIKAKLNEGLGSIFAGMADAVRPMMVEIKAIFGEFNKGSPIITLANGAMKSFLSTVFSLAAGGLHMLHLAFLNVEVAALRIAIFLLPVINAFRAMARNEAVINGIKTALMLLAVPIVAVAIVVGSLVSGFLIFATIVGAVITAVGGAIAWLVGTAERKFGELAGLLSGLGGGAWAAASNFVSGLVGGISAGVGAVVSAVKGLASAALASFSTGIQAASPSRAMHAKGRYQFAAGAVTGIDAGGADVEAAADRMGQRAVAASDASGGGSGGKGGGNTYMITITLPSGTGVDIVEQVRAAVRSVLEDELQAEPA